MEGAGVHQHIFLIFQLFESFFTGVAQNDPTMVKFLPKSGLDWLQKDQFWSFCRFIPSFLLKCGSDWLIMANFTRFTTFTIFCHQSISFLGEISKIFVRGVGEGISANFFGFATFLNCFTLDWLKMTLKGNFFQKSGLDWLQMTNFGHFAGFSNFSPKMRLRLTWNGQFHLIQNWKWPTMANFSTKVAWISSKCVILVKCQQKLKYLSRILTDLHWTFRTGLTFLSWSKWVQGVLCYDQNWWKLISQWNLDQSAPNLQNRARFSKLVEMSPRSGMLQSKLMET